MSVSTNQKGQLVPREAKAKTLAAALVDLKPAIATALPKHIDPERMNRVFLTCLRTTPGLNQCTLPSFLGSVLQLAQLGLDPSSGLDHAHLIPRKMKGVNTCTVIIGYKGLIHLAHQTGIISNVYAEVVREGDKFEYELGLHPDVRHIPLGEEDAPMTHAYAVAELKDGNKAFRVLTRGQVLKRRGGAKGPWETHEDAMWQKSALRALFKYLPQSSSAMTTAAAIDEAPEYGGRQQRFFSEETKGHLLEAGIDPDSDETPEPEVEA